MPARPAAGAAGAGRRIMVVTDAWRPQVNGVVRTLATVADQLTEMGHQVEVIGPDRFRTVPCPTYPEIRLAILPGRKLARLMEAGDPDCLHIATEGPLGLAARAWARRRGFRFTTSFHTRFAEYLQARTRIPAGFTYPFLRRFHGASSGTMVATASLRAELAARGFEHLRAWTRGVDLEMFHPPAADAPREDWGLPRPIFAYVGRVAVEKNIAAFLRLDLPGSKVVVGGGPQLEHLKRDFPSAAFAGPLFGPALARAYGGADVFVFPSLTDTFGLVMLEALACGTPVAAYPVTGPKDVLADSDGPIGGVDADLRAAAMTALGADREACRRHAEGFGWRACAEMFLRHLTPLHPEAAAAASEEADESGLLTPTA